MNINTEILVKAVQKVILNYEQINSTKKVSTQDIADSAKSCYTTIREIKKGILKSLSIKKSIEISSNLQGPKTLRELLELVEKNNANEAELYAKKYSHLFDYNLLPKNQDDLITDEKFSKIIWSAFSNEHITRDEIRYRWGKEGEDKLDYLLSCELLIEDEDIIKGSAVNAGGDVESAYKQLGVGYKLYNLTRKLTQENWASFQTNSVNERFIKEFREDLASLFKKFDEKSSSSLYHGNKRVFFGMLFDRFLEDFGSEKGKLQ